MSGCKNPCKALAKIEYENRYRKNNKLHKFWGNTSLYFKSEAAVCSAEPVRCWVTVPRRERWSLQPLPSCGCGAPLSGCCTAGAVIPDSLQCWKRLSQPLAGEGAGLARDRARTDGLLLSRPTLGCNLSAFSCHTAVIFQIHPTLKF